MRILVFQSDFGLGDGAVSAMKGIAYGVDGKLIISDITHDITPFNVWEASFRLLQVAEFWPEGTVFVSVVDPGVGSDRKSVVAKLVGDRFVVTPDNGSLTHLYTNGLVSELREIDESVNRLKGSGGSHTFHGRDVYAYTGARLAAGVIDFSGVGRTLPLEGVSVINKIPVRVDDGRIIGTAEIVDVRFGHLWSDISAEQLGVLDVSYGEKLKIEIRCNGKEYYDDAIPFCKSFSDVQPGDRMVYINSMMRVAVAIHGSSFAKTYGILSGVDWKMAISKA